MLPEQRGLLANLFSRFRSPQRTRRTKTGIGTGRKRDFKRIAHLETLEERRVLTTIYIDFGDRLGTLTTSDAAWSTYGLTVPQGQESWIQGPEFGFAAGTQITFQPFGNIVPAQILNAFQVGPDPATDPFEFNAGVEPPISKVAQMEDSIFEMIERQFAPFDVTVELEDATSLADIRNTLASNNRVDAGSVYLINGNATAMTPDPNFYNSDTAPTNAGHVPNGFDATQVDPTTGSPIRDEDVYVLIGGWTEGGQQVGVATGTKLGFSNDLGDPNNVLGEYPTFSDPNDPVFGGMGMGGGGGMGGMGGGGGMPIPITYADNGAAVAADTIARLSVNLTDPVTGVTALRYNTGVADIASQMIGLDYGLQHTSTGEATVGNPSFDTDVDLLSGSDVMRDGPQEAGQPFPSLNNVSVFSRFPLELGDFNQDPTEVQNAYDQLVGTTDILVPDEDNTLDGGSLAEVFGPEPGVGYVTGTGAFDHISLVNDTATGMIDVTVDAFRDNTYSPGSFIESFSYSIDPTGLDALLIETGNSDDQVDLDPTIALNTGIIGGGPGSLEGIQIFGGGGVNNFSMADNGSDTVAITATNLLTFAFSGVERFDTQMVLNAASATPTTIELQEFQDNSIVHLEGFSSLTYTMPEFLGDDFTLTAQAGSGLAVPPSNSNVDMTLDGTAGPTALSPVIGVCNVEFTNISSVLIQDPAGVENDTFTIVSDLGFADGMQNFEVDLGPGDDTLNLEGTDFLLPVAGGAFIYDGGIGNDTINASGDTDWTLSDTELQGTSVDLICENVENANITGGDSDNTIEVDSWAGNATLDGMGGNDTIIIGDSVSSVVSGNILADGGDGNDTFIVNSYEPGFDPTTGLINTLTLSGDGGNDNFQIGRNGDLNSVVGNVSVIGGAGTDTLTLDDSNSSAITAPNYFVGNDAVTDDAGFGGVTYDNTLENVSLTGSTGANIFDVTPSRTTGVTINGNDPPFPQAAGTGDQLIVEFGAVQNQQLTLDKPADGGGRWTFGSGQKPVVFSNIEQLQPFNPLDNVPLVATTAAGGAGSKPLVKVYNASNNALLFAFNVFESTFTGGVHVSIADILDSSGNFEDAEIVVSSGNGRVGEVKVYDATELLAAASTSTHLVTDPDAALLSDSGAESTGLTTTLNSKTATTAGLATGQSVTGPNVPAGTTINAINAAGTGITLSAKATATSTSTVTIGGLVMTLKTTKNSLAATVTSVTGLDGLVVGQSIVGSNLSSNTIISGLKIGAAHTITVTLSSAAIASGAFTDSNAGFLPEGSAYKSGLYVSAGDLDGDGIPDIVTSRVTGVPMVRVFNGATFTPELSPIDGLPIAFNPYTSKFTTGAQVAVGDVTGDGLADIVTVPGTGQTAQVKVFDFNTIDSDLDNGLAITPVNSFLGFESTFKKGESLALGDVNGDGTDEIMLGAGTNGTSRVRVLDDFGDLDKEFKAFTTGNTNAALQIAAADVNGSEELFVGQGIAGKTHLIKGFNPLSGVAVDSLLEADPSMIAGIFLG
jgi:hypothetical protein